MNEEMHKIVPWNAQSDGKYLEQNQVRPSERPVMTQIWADLFFAHARAEPDRIAKMLPEGLSLETYDGSAWVGFVPFQMQKLRFVDWRRVYHPYDFLETNLRTYVRHPVYGSGVWFFSLDATNYLACLAARIGFGLPYCYSGLAAQVSENELGFYGTRTDRQRLPRVWENPSRLLSYTCEFSPPSGLDQCRLGEFDYWLLERYRLFAADRKGRLITGRVWHLPYEVGEPSVRNFNLETSDSRLQGLNFEHFRYASSVQVEAFKPALVSSSVA